MISVLLFKHDPQLFFQIDFQTFDSSTRVFKAGRIDLKKEKFLSYGALSYSAGKPECRAGKTRVPTGAGKSECHYFEEQLM